jgi:flavin-dependent dehydrogenase
MQSAHIKTIIIGAGPAGVTCGYTLIKNKEECLLIDRRTFPREKLCGGGLTPRAHKLIDRIFENIKYDYCKVNTIDLYDENRQICSFHFDTEVRTIARKDFDHALLKEYQKKGGRFITDIVSEIGEKDGIIHLTLASGQRLTCNYLIGADGANSIVRKYIQPQFDRGIICLEKTVTGDHSIKDIRVYFGKAYPKGYLYVFPNPHGYVVGYGNGNTDIDVFHESLERYDLTNNNKTKGAYIPAFCRFDYPFYKHIMLIGDAGGYVDSMTGEGVPHAVKSGENAALSIINNTDFRELNKPVLNLVKRRMTMCKIFFYPPVNKLFIYMCKKPSLLSKINRRINQSLAEN